MKRSSETKISKEEARGVGERAYMKSEDFE